MFWADASDATPATDAEDIFASLLGIDEKVEAKKVGVILDAMVPFLLHLRLLPLFGLRDLPGVFLAQPLFVSWQL